MKVRSDLEGVVWVRLGASPVMLQAGDEIPDGVSLGEHLVEKPRGKTTRRKAAEEQPDEV